jgi:hypothetical protein
MGCGAVLALHALPGGSKKSGAFLKKRTKKLLRTAPSPSGNAEAKTDKSFLLLFFKKEVLP